MATFEWRSNGNQQNNTPPFDTGEGCLFLCSSHATSQSPSLTLVPPTTDTIDYNYKNNYYNNSNGTTILPSAGDDLSPPNAVQASKLNGIAVPVSASAGWSTSPPTKEGVYPSCVAYDLKIKANSNGGAVNDSLELSVALEYSNPHFERGESMVVKVAIAKTLVNEELGTELALVATQFQEFLTETNKWVDITADVEYTQTAKAVVDAVLKDPTAGQTAGIATVTAKTVELTLGPFSAKARIYLTFQADNLYSYETMSVRDDAADIGAYRLLPLWINIPFAPVDHEAGLSNFAIQLQAPTGTSILPVDQYQFAYWDLKKQDGMKIATILAVSELEDHGEGNVGFRFQWESLPPRSTGILAWLTLRNHIEEDSIFDFVHIGRSLANLGGDPTAQQAQATLLIPSATDSPNLKVPLPGHGPMGSLYRVKVKMPEAQPRQQPYHVMNLTLSDRSGSTAVHVNGASMRQKFNELAEVRFLMRLKSIPALVKANVLRMNDIVSEVFLAFDHSAPQGAIRRCVFRVSDVHDSIVAVVQAIRSGNNFGANQLPTVLQHVQAIRGVSPGGATDFSVGPKTLMEAFVQWEKEAQAMAAVQLAPCAFVEFDTDGGHNGAGNYLQCLENFCRVFDVRDGVVTGFGKWLNQDCASKVARVLGGVPALLALQVPGPGSAGLDKVFRAGFSAWVSSLRKPPKMTLQLSAGSISFPAPVSSRNANAVEVLGFRRVGERHVRLPRFGPPDVSNETFTKAVLTEVPGGDEIILYLVSRLGSSQELAKALLILCTTDGLTAPAIRGRVQNEDETTEGGFLAYDWLCMLTSQKGEKGFELAPIMATSLSSRLEDEVSFRFNIASPSGKTSFLGRCKTVANRAPIDSAHQPEPPEPPLKPISTKPKETTGLFGTPAPSTPSSAPTFLSTPQAKFGDRFHSSSSGSGVLISTYMGGPEITRSVGGGAFSFGGAIAAAALVPTPFGAPSPSEVMCRTKKRGNIPRKGGGICKREARGIERGPAGRPTSNANHAGHSQRREPSWKDALTVPAGAETPLYKQDYDDLLNAMSQIVHARQRLQNDPSVIYVCDVCGDQFALGEHRYHCFDCQDFDVCIRCRDKHTKPFHRLALLNALSAPTQPAEDPLVGVLLKSTADTADASGGLSQRPQYDRTMNWCKLRVYRFLLSVLHWWPIFRNTCAFHDRLPADLANDMGERIVKGFNNDDLHDLLETVTIIVDSLMREHTALRDSWLQQGGI